MADDVVTSCMDDKICNLTDQPGAVYQVTFTVQPDIIDPILRLKAPLKRAGRDLKFRCTSVRDLTVGQPKP